ncbi:unnamed protein product, partial [Menidia menidia]
LTQKQLLAVNAPPTGPRTRPVKEGPLPPSFLNMFADDPHLDGLWRPDSASQPCDSPPVAAGRAGLTELQPKPPGERSGSPYWRRVVTAAPPHLAGPGWAQESLGRPNSLTVPASRLLSYLPSLSSQAGRLGCQATVKWSSEAEASIRPSWLKLSVLTGQSSREKQRTHTSSSTSHRLTSASALPVAKMLMQPLPLVRKNMSLSLFQEISFTSNLNCSSALERCVLASMKVTTSSLLPTAMDENARRFVKRPGRESSAIAAPRHRVDLGSVGRELATFVVISEALLHFLVVLRRHLGFGNRTRYRHTLPLTGDGGVCLPDSELLDLLSRPASELFLRATAGPGPEPLLSGLRRGPAGGGGALSPGGPSGSRPESLLTGRPLRLSEDETWLIPPSSGERSMGSPFKSLPVCSEQGQDSNQQPNRPKHLIILLYGCPASLSELHLLGYGMEISLKPISDRKHGDSRTGRRSKRWLHLLLIVKVRLHLLLIVTVRLHLLLVLQALLLQGLAGGGQVLQGFEQLHAGLSALQEQHALPVGLLLLHQHLRGGGKRSGRSRSSCSFMPSNSCVAIMETGGRRTAAQASDGVGEPSGGQRLTPVEAFEGFALLLHCLAQLLQLGPVGLGLRAQLLQVALALQQLARQALLLLQQPAHRRPQL